MDKINYMCLCSNPDVFMYNYEAMKNITSIFTEELVEKYDYDIGEDFL